MQVFSLLSRLLLVGGFSLMAPRLLAQGASGPALGGLGPSVFSVGTSAQVGSQRWAYVIWQPTESGLVSGQRFAIYRKVGLPSAAGNYVRQGDVQPRLTRESIALALATGAKLGDDLEDLAHGLTALLKDERNDLSAEEKVLAVLRAAIADESVLQRLMVMARVHPSLALVLGLGHAEALPAAGVYSYEIRLLADGPAATEVGVIGRVVVNTTLTPLPAPSDVFTFFEPNERGHLNAKIRWANPAPLRLRALEHYGYNVYRVAKVEAILRGWVAAAPTTAALLAAVGDNSNPKFRRVNDVPVLPESDLTPAAALNAADITTYFLADDNGRFDPEAPRPPLQDGDEFYYYAAALDVLGRDGLISNGRLAAVYDMYPPEAPRDLVVSNEYQKVGASRRQFLRLTWEAPPSDSDGVGIREYLVYRWETDRAITASNQAVAAGGALPASIGVVAHVPLKTSYSFDDLGAGAPVAADAGKTYWYTVRARDLSRRPGGNLSGNSVPAFGVIRDRQGPAAATGSIRLNCLNPLVSADPQQALNQGSDVILSCRAPLDSRLAWAEFSMGNVSLGQYAMRRRSLQVGGGPVDMLVAEVAMPAARLYAGGSKTQEMRVQCRVATHSGRLSAPAFQSLPSTAPVNALLVPFKGETQRVSGLLGDAICGFRHDLFGGGTPRQRFSICGDLNISPGTREYKIYRRVGNGPLTLVDFGPRKSNVKGKAISGFDQILNPAVPVGWCDSTVPAGTANLCYYAQSFDEHGNASALARLGCVESTSDLAAPTLLPLEPSGTSASPKMVVRWFGSVHEATRYELFVSRNGQPYHLLSTGPVPGLSPDLAPLDASGKRVPQRLLGETQGDFSAHETSMLSILKASATLQSDSMLSFELPIDLGVNYKVFVRAVGQGRRYAARPQSAPSNVQDLLWAPSAAGAPQVPWPARLGGSAQDVTSFHPQIAAFPMQGRVPGFEGVGVRIGAVDIQAEADGSPFFTQIDDPQFDGQRKGQYPPRPTGNGVDFSVIARSVLRGSYDPMLTVFSNDTQAQIERGLNQPNPGLLLPVVLYRYEVPSSLHPAGRLSNDVVQVTPMMEQIAYEKHSGTGNTIIHDPWISVLQKVDATFPRSHEVFLLDRNPVTSKAAYRYILVRFNSRTMEIERVLETAPVNIP